jgi:arylsulfatase
LGAAERPNIVIVMVDDLGCYGGEIDTPNLDRLAGQGLRFSQFHNVAKCETTRTTLLTGRHHQDVTQALRNTTTFGEELKRAGYFTMASGKWQPSNQSPTERGFDRYFGFRGGMVNHFTGEHNAKELGFWLNDRKFEVPKKGFYTTTAFTDYALRFLSEASEKKAPFLLYLAYDAPHFHLQAPEEAIRKYKGRFSKGWDVLREERHQRQLRMGLFANHCLSPRPPEVLAWNTLGREEQENEAYLMETYAAMVDILDQDIGRLVEHLKRIDRYDNTIILFFSDNGAEGGVEPWNDSPAKHLPGSDPDSRLNQGRGWANLSNTPFRLHKLFMHEGGIASPLIAWHGNRIRNQGKISDRLCHVVDIMPTCLELAGAEYPAQLNNRKLSPLDGLSLLPEIQGRRSREHEALCFQFIACRAIRTNEWKLVQRGTPSAISKETLPWELYRIATDRTELRDLAKEHPEMVGKLSRQWDAWYRPRHGTSGQMYPHPDYGTR